LIEIFLIHSSTYQLPLAYPTLSPEERKHITGEEHPDESESNRIEQDRAGSGRILHSSPGQTSAVEESREFSGDPNPTKRTSTTQNKNQENGAAVAPFPGLTDKNLEVISSEFPNLDFSTVYGKFVDHHTCKGTKAATLVMLRGWFKRELPAKQSAAEASLGPAANPEPEPPETSELPKLEFRDCPLDLQLDGTTDSMRKEYGWFIGDKKIAAWGSKSEFVRDCRKMPSGNYDECREYLLRIATECKFKGEWDVRDALIQFSGDSSRSPWILFTETDWNDDLEPIGWTGIKTSEDDAKAEAAIS
jgi:hypothetical protein